MLTEHDDVALLRAEIATLREELLNTTVLIKKIHHHTVVATTMRFVWAFIIIGVPVVAYVFAGSFIEDGLIWLRHTITGLLNEEIQKAVEVYLGH